MPVPVPIVVRHKQVRVYHLVQQCLDQVLARAQLEQRLAERDVAPATVPAVVVADACAAVHALAPGHADCRQLAPEELLVEGHEQDVDVWGRVDVLPGRIDKG